MTARTEHFADWLRDAHAMEKQALAMLSGQAARLEHYPELKARIERHHAETEQQLAILERLLERQDESRSVMKDLGGRMAAMGQAMGGMLTTDEVVKGSLASYAFEHLEAASYRILIAAAEHIGDAEAAEALGGILEQEEAMADWLFDHLPQVTRTYLDRDEAGLTARR